MKFYYLAMLGLLSLSFNMFAQTAEAEPQTGHSHECICKDFNYMGLAKDAAEKKMFYISMPAALQSIVALAENPGSSYQYYEGSVKGLRSAFKRANCDLSVNGEEVSVTIVKGNGLTELTEVLITDGYNNYRVRSVTQPIKFGNQILSWAPVNLNVIVE